MIPIDLRLGVDFDMLLITGPNTGGKTLALKTGGLFALMTRAGLPVPADDGTTVPLYDRVCADIGDEQEIRQNLSTFASHLVRVRAALADATPESLVLLDELGGGTDPDEGGALGTAVLERLLLAGVPTLVSTHIGKLKESSAYRHARAENACAEFDHETLAPRYRLMLGTPGESCALVIARRIGLDQRVCDVAAERLERREGELDELMGDVRSARMAAEGPARGRSRMSLSRARGRHAGRRGAREGPRGALGAARTRGPEGHRGAHEGRHADARARAVAAGSAPQGGRGVHDRDARPARGPAHRSLAHGAARGLPPEPREGSLVFLPRYRQRVIVHKLDHDRRMLVAKMGSMKVKVSFDEVTPYESL